MGLRARKRQVAVQTEATPGTAGTLVGADVSLRVKEATSPQLRPRMYDPDEVQEYPDSRPLEPGISEVTVDAMYTLRGPGDLTSSPAAKAWLESALFSELDVKKATIGSVTSGPFVNLEVVTGAPSGGTGLVWLDTADGASVIYFLPLTGAIANGDTLTGAESGATVTLSGAPTEAGHLYRQSDSNFGAGDPLHHATVGFLLDGAAIVARSALSELSMECVNGQPVTMSHSFLGVLESDADKALFDKSAGYPEAAVKAPRFQGVNLLLDAYAPEDAVSMRLSFPVGLALREDIQKADGIRFCGYQRSAPQIVFAPAFVKKAAYDGFTKLTGGETFYLKFGWGTLDGSTWEVHAPEAQFEEVTGPTNREGLAEVSNTVRCAGKRNNSIFLWSR